MKIALGSDHAGFELKEKVKGHLITQGFEVNDAGTFSAESVDYPDYARQVAGQVSSGKAARGILVCGTGIGMCIAANKIDGIRAANARSEDDARLTREHNDANVLCLGGRVLEDAEAIRIVDLWLVTPFLGGRHQRRLDKIAESERAVTQ